MGAAAPTTGPAEGAVARLRRTLRGAVLLPAEPGYDDARRLWNGRVDRRPALIARCRGAADVVECVRWARTAGVPLSVRGTGHHVSGDAVCEDGLVIDVSAMDAVRVDPAARTARAEPGVTWRHFDRETQAFGLATTGAMLSTVAVGGVTLGGGLGWLMRRHGLTVDNLRSADVVTADGRLLTASAGAQPDLFWALRGGGGNFGVVTSLEYVLHPVGPVVTGGMLLHPIGRARDLLRLVRDFLANAPDELGCVVSLWTSPPLPFVPAELHGRPSAAVLMCHSGSVDEGLRCLAPLRDFGPPLADRVGPMPYTSAQRMLDPAGAFGRRVAVASDHLAELDDRAVEALVAAAERMPSPLSVVNVVALGGAVARAGALDTAYGHRNAAFHYAAYALWEDAGDDRRHMAWARSVGDALAPFAAGAYVNELGDEGEERTRAAYHPAALHHLAAVKRAYDPGNLFRHNRNIAP